MNLSETADLLTAMSAYDRRTIGDGDVIAWQAILSDASFDDCLEAVKQHYAEHTEWIMPAHVRRAVRDMVSQREMAARATGWAPGQHGVPKDQAMPEIAGPVDEGSISGPVRALLDSVRAMLPEGSREALMPRAAYWGREHRAFVRTRDGEPNPLYRPKAGAATVHLVHDGSGAATCCHRTPFELPLGECITTDPLAATCTGDPKVTS